jgi:hypothetical protein
MDRRMYRGNMGNNCGCSRNNSQFRHSEPVCEDVCGNHIREDMCEKHVCEDMCDKSRHDGDFDRFPIAMCYVPWQCFRDLYENEFAALANGTLFKELDLKWYGRGCK